MSHSAERNQEASAQVASDMAERGFVSVFEYIRPVMESRTVWVLWLNLRTDEEVLTCIDSQGDTGFYKLSRTSLINLTPRN